MDNRLEKGRKAIYPIFNAIKIESGHNRVKTYNRHIGNEDTSPLIEHLQRSASVQLSYCCFYCCWRFLFAVRTFCRPEIVQFFSRCKN